MTRNVRGILFADYIRMLRRHKEVHWPDYLGPTELAFLTQKIDENAWYSMDSFERLGNAILEGIVAGKLDAVRMWGVLSVTRLRKQHPELVAEGDPVESLMRFRVLRNTFFDFDAFQMSMVSPGQCRIVIHYHMGAKAEEAASYQAMGFFEGVLGAAGARSITSTLLEKSWQGDDNTLLDLKWEQR